MPRDLWCLEMTCSALQELPKFSLNLQECTLDLYKAGKGNSPCTNFEAVWTISDPYFYSEPVLNRTWPQRKAVFSRTLLQPRRSKPQVTVRSRICLQRKHSAPSGSVRGRFRCNVLPQPTSVSWKCHLIKWVYKVILQLSEMFFGQSCKNEWKECCLTGITSPAFCESSLFPVLSQKNLVPIRKCLSLYEEILVL